MKEISIPKIVKLCDRIVGLNARNILYISEKLKKFITTHMQYSIELIEGLKKNPTFSDLSMEIHIHVGVFLREKQMVGELSR